MSDKDRKSFANDLRRIYGYGAPNEELAFSELDELLRNGSRNILTL